jgi:hypothetical protein
MGECLWMFCVGPWVVLDTQNACRALGIVVEELVGFGDSRGPVRVACGNRNTKVADQLSDVLIAGTLDPVA